MPLTPEQESVVAHVRDNTGLVKVSAVAGSGKTTLLTNIARLPFVKNGLYLAYTKAVATEATMKFPTTVSCCTTHSLAYGPTVKQNKFVLGELSHRDVKLPHYDDRVACLSIFREFCLSEHIDFLEFTTDYHIPEEYIEPVQDLLERVGNKELPCSHTFYLKYFHIQLATGQITYNPFDIIMLDEAGDLNLVTYEIFKLLPSDRKIMVGDSMQNIFGFNHTIDCFALTQDEGSTFPMTRSFRVSSFIAKRIELFCKTYLDPSMVFRGVPLTDLTITTKAYIARTNSSIIEKIITLNATGIAYTLTRTPEKLFEQVLSFIGFKHKGFISDPSIRYLQLDIDNYYTKPELQKSYKTLFSYLLNLYPTNPIIKSNISLIMKFGSDKIINAFNQSKQHKTVRNSLVLGTAHSTKGLEYDEVELAEDMNSSIDDIVEALNIANYSNNYYTLSDNERTELNLYYVACSRARKNLVNARHLPTLNRSQLLALAKEDEDDN